MADVEGGEAAPVEYGDAADGIPGCVLYVGMLVDPPLYVGMLVDPPLYVGMVP
jgi:hypothetical protein